MGTSITSHYQARSERLKENGEIDVLVLFSDVTGTLPALRAAAKLALGLNARIRLLVPQVVRYPLLLERPPVQPDFLASRYRTISEHAEIETTGELLHCRDYWDAVNKGLEPGSTVILGFRRACWNGRRWLTRGERSARRLRAIGHQVILIETK